ncbi:MAG: type II secretory pathway, component PulD [Opitutales bacterium]
MAPLPVAAQSDAREKIRLLSSALRARDAGDLQQAKESLEELIRIAPDDPNVQRLLASVNQDLERQMEGRPTVFGQAADSDPEAVMGSPPPETTKKPKDTGPTRSASTEPYDSGEADPSSPSSTDTAGDKAASDQAERLLEAAAKRQRADIEAAEDRIREARSLAKDGSFAQADRILNDVEDSLPLLRATDDLYDDLEEARRVVAIEQAEDALDRGSFEEATALVDQYETRFGADSRSRGISNTIAEASANPTRQDLSAISPGFVERQEQMAELMVEARAQFIAGDYRGAQNTLLQVEALDPNNAEAKAFQALIAERLQSSAYLNRVRTREQMLNEVALGWERPRIFDRETGDVTDAEPNAGILQKIRNIKIPRVSFSGELSRVLDTLADLSVEYDDPSLPEIERGVNIVLIDPQNVDPRVNISLRGLSLQRILELVTQQVNFQFTVAQDAIIVSRGSEQQNSSLVTEFFPISRATVIRLTGFRSGGGGGGQAGPVDPFAAPAQTPSSDGPSLSEEEDALKSFFERAGVDFSITGSSLAFDGTQLIVTQTPIQLDRLRTILRNYDQTKQVEIEAKFLEVQQGDLEELGFEWMIGSGGSPQVDANGNPVLDERGNPVFGYDTNFETSGRTLNSVFGVNSETAQVSITGQEPVDASPPVLPNQIDLASGAAGLFNTLGVVNGADIQLMINALSRKQGSDLMSAPRITVLSGKTATITVAQELLYPESYGDSTATVSTGGSSGGAAGGQAVAITSGTPQDFVRRNVGVEMEVTPTVEDNDNISLLLEPEVTEFEGFVEYGGPSVAISGGTTVTVPSGFFQPIFSTRSVRTEVTIFDGATVVLGGLVREEIKMVEDKVPVLGDIPLVGRLFQSKGETAQKRNLMIFVTANLISPAGSPSRQRLPAVEPNSLFQNPMIVTPGGGIQRGAPEPSNP